MKQILLIVGLVFCLASSAQTTREQIENNLSLAGGTYLPYWGGNTELTPAPEGYKPFYISHYGRHGSRYVETLKYFTNIISPLKQAEKEGKLSPLGKTTLKAVLCTYDFSKEHEGELTALGGREHEGIAARMVQNYPEVFSKGSYIDARASCMLRAQRSMQHFCAELNQRVPDLNIHQSHRDEDAYFLYPQSDSSAVTPAQKVVEERMEHAVDSLRRVPKAVDRLFVNKAAVKQFVKRRAPFTQNLYDVYEDLQCLPELEAGFPSGLFKAEELFDIWKGKNIQWVMRGGQFVGSHPQYRMMYGLMRNVISCADEVIAGGKNGASLRFGHDKQLYPFCYILGVDGLNRSIPANQYDSTYKYSANFQIVPMAANIQFVFYRKSGSGKILVKILLNEQETHIPVETAIWPYYDWKEVRAFCLKRMETGL